MLLFCFDGKDDEMTATTARAVFGIQYPVVSSQYPVSSQLLPACSMRWHARVRRATKHGARGMLKLCTQQHHTPTVSRRGTTGPHAAHTRVVLVCRTNDLTRTVRSTAFHVVGGEHYIRPLMLLGASRASATPPGPFASPRCSPSCRAPAHPRAHRR